MLPNGGVHGTVCYLCAFLMYAQFDLLLVFWYLSVNSPELIFRLGLGLGLGLAMLLVVSVRNSSGELTDKYHFLAYLAALVVSPVKSCLCSSVPNCLC